MAHDHKIVSLIKYNKYFLKINEQKIKRPSTTKLPPSPHLLMYDQSRHSSARIGRGLRGMELLLKCS